MRFYSTTKDTLKKTALYDFHLQHDAKMVPYAGWTMPLMYDKLGVLASHFHTRQNASLFDVSHMLQTKWKGRDAVRFIESLVVGDIKNLPHGSSTLSLFTTSSGGILDDCVINRKNQEELYVVSNAGCADKVWSHVQDHLIKFQNQGGDVDIQTLHDYSLIALQGPSASSILSSLTKTDLSDMGFMTAAEKSVESTPIYASRCGYTGEDGFELSVPSTLVASLCTKLLQVSKVELAGLGARDSLRLEAGLCLYGNDIDENTSPVEAGLTWTIGKSRRESGGFLGSDLIIPQIKGGVDKRRVGIIVQGAPARGGAEILDKDGQTVIGKVTSGIPSPVLQKNVAMGYVATGFHKVSTQVQVKVRNKLYPASIVKMPFVPHSYYRK